MKQVCRRKWWLEAGVVAGGATATVVLTLVPDLQFAINRPALHSMLEMVGGLVSALVTFLLLGRYRRSQRRCDLLLCAALAMLAASHLGFAALPHALLDRGVLPFHAWATLPTNLLAALAFLAAALAGDRRVGPGEGPWILAGLALSVVIVTVTVVLFATDLPTPVVAEPGAHRPALESHPLVMGAQYLAVVLYAVAGLLLGMRARREEDDMLRGLGIAAILATFARVNFIIYPTLFTHYVSTGDLFRLLAQGVLLVVCAREISSYWQRHAEGAVLSERRRIARDLHDGVAQDLAFILRRAQRMAAASDDVGASHIAAAAKRALEDSRRAIDALARDPGEPLDAIIASATVGIADRGGSRLLLDLESGIQIPPAHSDALVRIACEAVANASAHADPEAIRIELRNHDGVRLRVTDDGTGFDPEAPEPENGRGFGIISMRERAKAVGGELRLRSARGAGTELEVVLP